VERFSKFKNELKRTASIALLMFVSNQATTLASTGHSLSEVERRIAFLPYEVGDAWDPKGNWVWESKGNRFSAPLDDCQDCVVAHGHLYWVGFASVDFPDVETADRKGYVEIRAVQGLPNHKVIHSVLHRNTKFWNINENDYKKALVAASKKYHTGISTYRYWSAGQYNPLLVPNMELQKPVFDKVMTEVWTRLCEKWDCKYSFWTD